MDQYEPKRALVLEISSGRATSAELWFRSGTELRRHVVPEPGASFTGEPAALLVGLHRRERLRIRWQDLAGIAFTDVDQTIRVTTFYDALGELAPAPIQRVVSELGVPGELVLRAAFASAPGALDPQLRPLLDALDTHQRDVIRTSTLELLDGDGLFAGALLVAGLLADAAAVLRIGDAIVDTPPGEPSPWRHVYGIEALLLCGTRDAYMQVQRIATASHSNRAIANARKALLRIAGEKAVPVWEVEDQLVPSCGLDAGNDRLIDYGSRAFELHLDDQLAPFLRLAGGRESYSEPPPAEAGEDDADVQRAARRWAVVREQVREAVPVQVQRLEESLVQQYRWDAHHWVDNVLRHPLLMHLAQRCIWGVYSRTGRKLLHTFRVERDRTFWGPDDEPFELEVSDRTIGLVHPLDLDEPTTDAWGMILADYEVVTLFPQIDRRTYTHPVEEARNQDLFVDVEISAASVTQLHRRGWSERESWGDHLEKVYRAQNVRCSMRVDLSPTAEPERISELSFHRYLGFPQSKFQLRDVPAIVFSETMYELELLRNPQGTGAFAAIPPSFKRR